MLFCFVLFLTPIPSIHTGIGDNPPERNIEGLETEAEERASRKPNRKNSSLTCCSSMDGQQELFPYDFTLSFPHFSSPPTFSTPFLCPPQGASVPFHTHPPSSPFLFHSSPPLLFPLFTPLVLTSLYLSPLHLSLSLSVAFLSFL